MGMFDFLKRQKTVVEHFPRPKQKRSVFSGTATDRLTGNWTSTPLPINATLQNELRPMRARARDLAKNNDYVRRFLQLAKTNVVGSKGIQLQSLIVDTNGTADIEARQAIESAWREFSRKGRGEYTGLLTMCAAQMLMIESLLRDGEVIIQKVRSARDGFQYKIIDPELLSVSRTDDSRYKNDISMGVEFNRQGKIVAYHISKSYRNMKTSSYAYEADDFDRIPAENIIHAFIPEYADQMRGYPAGMMSALKRLRQLAGYEEAEVVAARVGAAKMGFFTRSGEGAGYAGEQFDEDGNPVKDIGDDGLYMEAEAGTFEELPHGVDFKMFDPNHPAGAYQSFVKTILRGISSGLGVAYNTLSNDLEGVNFSSIRTSVLEDREVWKTLQEWLIENVLCELYFDWLETELVRGIPLTGGRGTLRTVDLLKYKAHTFQARRWQWIDPTKDVQASILAVQNNIKTVSDVIRESGRDPDDVFRERQREIELMQELGIYNAPVAQPEEEQENDEVESNETDEEEGNEDE